MNFILILLFMIFFHIVDDYYLQGVLANMKQKSWWKKQEGYSENYKNDYLVALITHSFSWSFMIMIPYIFIGASQYVVLFSIGINALIHGIVDDLKANKKKINLIQDQTIHAFQIFITWVVVALLGI